MCEQVVHGGLGVGEPLRRFVPCRGETPGFGLDQVDIAQYALGVRLGGVYHHQPDSQGHTGQFAAQLMLLQIQIVQALLLRAQVAFAGGGAEYQLAVVDIAAEQRVVARAHAVAGDAAAGLAQGTGVFHSCHGGVGRLQVVFGDAMAEAHDLQDRIVRQADAFGVLPGLAAFIGTDDAG